MMIIMAVMGSLPLFPPRPRDAVKAIKKRVVGNNNFQEVMLTLTVNKPSLRPGPRFTKASLA